MRAPHLAVELPPSIRFRNILKPDWRTLFVKLASQSGATSCLANPLKAEAFWSSAVWLLAWNLMVYPALLSSWSTVSSVLSLLLTLPFLRLAEGSVTRLTSTLVSPMKNHGPCHCSMLRRSWVPRAESNQVLSPQDHVPHPFRGWVH